MEKSLIELETQIKEIILDEGYIDVQLESKNQDELIFFAYSDAEVEIKAKLSRDNVEIYDKYYTEKHSVHITSVSLIKLIENKILNGYTKEEFTSIIICFINEKKIENDMEFKINELYVVGSRVKQTHKNNSDLDILFIYDDNGETREDDMFSILNDDRLVINDINVDFIPHSSYKGRVKIGEDSLKLI